MIVKSIILYPENVKSCFKTAYKDALDSLNDASNGSKVFISLAPEENSQNMTVLAKFTMQGLIRIWLNAPKLKAFGVQIPEKSEKAKRLERIIADAFEKSGLAKIARAYTPSFPFGPDLDIADRLQEALIEISDNVIEEFKL